MPPRSFPNPAPKTESAREARKSFFCELCQKGYSRMNEFEAHEASYDHQHKKRLKEMKQMQRDPNASDKARRAERRADEKSGLITIKPVNLGGTATTASAASGGGFKKGGLKSAFGLAKGDGDEAPVEKGTSGGFKKLFGGDEEKKMVRDEDAETDTEDEGYEYYDPRRPTGCGHDCPGRHV